MTTPPLIRPDPKRKWYGLALRHLRMASRLLDSGFADGAAFHAYHAYECVLSSFISARGYQVPPEGSTMINISGKNKRVYPSPGGYVRDSSAHKARLALFRELADTTRPYYRHNMILMRYLTLDVRMDALYYDVNKDLLPHESYNSSFASNIVPQVHLFAKEVWKDIR